MLNRPKEPHAKDPRKLDSGRWQARVTYYDPETGKRRETSQTFATEREAKRWSREQEAEYRQDPNRKPPSEETVSDYLDHWFPEMIAQRALRPSSVARYRADLDHLQRLIGDRPLKNLGVALLEGKLIAHTFAT